ncbi:MAG: monovalent cation/H(+) antiporter subunit G [Opitutales bacterium]|nr:monovalent cation/H(+) antiporter subunit G [Opitutales bacterium]
MSIDDILVAALILLGCAVLLISAIGIIRLPDVYCRSHALGKGMTLGISLLLMGLWLYLGTEKAGIKVPLAIAFQFATIPVASHLLSRVAYQTGIPFHKGSKRGQTTPAASGKETGE